MNEDKGKQKVLSFLFLWHQHFLVHFNVDQLILTTFKEHYMKEKKNKNKERAFVEEDYQVYYQCHLHALDQFVLCYNNFQICLCSLSRNGTALFFNLCFASSTGLYNNIYVCLLSLKIVNNLTFFSPRIYSASQNNKKKNVYYIK